MSVLGRATPFLIGGGDFVIPVTGVLGSTNLFAYATSLGWNGVSRVVMEFTGTGRILAATGSGGLNISGVFPGGVLLNLNGASTGISGGGGLGGLGRYAGPGDPGDAGRNGVDITGVAVTLSGSGSIGGGSGGGGGGGGAQGTLAGYRQGGNGGTGGNFINGPNAGGPGDSAYTTTAGNGGDSGSGGGAGQAGGTGVGDLNGWPGGAGASGGLAISGWSNVTQVGFTGSLYGGVV